MFLVNLFKSSIYYFSIVFLTFGLMSHAAVFAASAADECVSIGSRDGEFIEINKPGKYCLSSDLYWGKSGAAIRISASHVRVDFRGYKIVGQDGVRGQIGLLVSDKIENVLVENGIIKNFHVGFKAFDVNNIIVRKMRFDHISWIGAHLSGSNMSLQSCSFFSIGYKHGAGQGESYAVGVLAYGQEISILNNIFNNVVRPFVDKSWRGEGVSILISEGSSGINVSSNSFYVEPSRRLTSIGVWMRADNVDVTDNKIYNIYRPIEGHFGGRVKILRNIFD